LFEEHGDKFIYINIDLDKSTDLVISEGINSFPAIMLFKNEQLLETMIGVQSEAGLLDKINSYL
jgi:thioredoxin-like negative regulator of GroEL